MFKTIADIRKALVIGSRWHTIHHGTTSQPTKKDMGVRIVSIVQSKSFAFVHVKADGTKTDSWCDFPKKENVLFHETTPASFTIMESGKPLLTYTVAEPKFLVAKRAADVRMQNVKTTTATVNPEPSTPNKGDNIMSATRKELVTLAANVNRIMDLKAEDLIDLSNKATVATLTAAVTALASEFTTADFAETTAPEFRFTPEDVATLAKISITPPQPKATKRGLVGGKKVKKAKGTTASTPKKDAYTRNHALVDALKNGGGTKAAIVKAADVLYREKNPNAKVPAGKKELFVSEVLFRYSMPSLLLLGIVSASAEKEPVFTLTHDKA